MFPIAAMFPDQTKPHRPNLRAALRILWETKWQHCRSGKTLLSQAEIAITALEATRTHTAQEVTPRHVQRITALWYGQGLSPATITKRLNCLSALGVNVTGERPTKRPQLKWHLPEAQRLDVMDFLRSRERVNARLAEVSAAYVGWTATTGLRLEETLALKRTDISNGPSGWTVQVPGTKTAKSQATLPLSAEQVSYANVAMRHRNMHSNDCLFNITYDELRSAWSLVREEFGWVDEPTCTLKALRRSAARYLHVDCGMPLDMVRQYLRHEKIETTLEYLRLTGGYGTEEMRRFLK